MSDQTTSTALSATPYDLLGGDAGVHRLVDRFYEIMETEPEAAPIRAMHAADLGPMRDKLFQFMSGWLGGPRRYTGCIMSAHRPFAIGAAERDQWLMCMRRALAEIAAGLPVQDMLERPLFDAAEFIRNR